MNLLRDKQEETFRGGTPTDGTGEETKSSEPSPQQKAELTQYEIKLAVTDFNCGETSGSTETALNVRFALEDEFLAKNKTKLDELVAKYPQQ